MKYEVLTMAQLEEAAAKIPESEVWATARKEAYREGYLAAVQEYDRLAAMGFVREKERRNLLMWHLGTALRAWVYDKSQRSIYKAPKAWIGSTWWDIRKKVFDRDGEVCEFCGTTEDLEIDHIHEVKDGGLPFLDNLRVLCKSCNSGRNSQKSTCRGRK